MCQITIIEKETRIINTVHFFTKDLLRIAQMNSFVNIMYFRMMKKNHARWRHRSISITERIKFGSIT